MDGRGFSKSTYMKSSSCRNDGLNEKLWILTFFWFLEVEYNVHNLGKSISQAQIMYIMYIT